MSAFWKLNVVMSSEPDSECYGNELEPDLTELPGWRYADEITRARIIEAARIYLLTGDPETSKWLGTNQNNRAALAGYRALHLLRTEDPGFLDKLVSEVWKKWAPIILSYPIMGNNKQAKVHSELIEKCYQSVPDEILDTLEVLINKENRAYDTIFIVHKVEHCWDERIAKRLCAKATDPELKPTCMRSLLSTFLSRDTREAQEFAESLVTVPLPTDADSRERSLAAGQALMESAPDAGCDPPERKPPCFDSDSRSCSPSFGISQTPHTDGSCTPPPTASQ